MSENSPNEKKVEELVLTQTYILEAMMNLLEKKGLVSREEIVKELKAMQANSFEKMKAEN